MKVRSRQPLNVPTSEVRRALIAFRPALRGLAPKLVLAVILALAGTALELAKPWPITWILDRLVTAGTEAGGSPNGTTTLEPAVLVLLAGVAVAIPTLLGMVNERLELTVAKVSRKATVRIRSEVFEHLQRLDLAEHHRHYSGDLLTRLMGDVNMIRDLLFPSWLNLLARGSVLVGASVVFAAVDWRLFLVALIPLPLLWLSVERGSTAIRAAAGKQRRKEGAIAAQAAESLRQVGLIKAFSAEARSASTFRSAARSAERATMAATRHAARMSRLTEILTGAGVALVLVLGARRTQAGLLSPGELVLAVSYTRMIYKPIRKLTGEGARIAKATACAGRVLDLLDRPAERHEGGDSVADLAGDIHFDDVHHRYPDGRRSVSGLTATIPASSLVVVTGENGSGKSTMLSLLLRLRQPASGTIRIAGTDISRYDLAGYRNQIAYVPQELALFGGTIRENIAFGRPEATEAEILAAAEAVLLTSVLDDLPDGLDTVLDENGSSLSGGQARRLMLARAAVRDGSILLLDEPLTGLDPQARVLVAAGIANISEGRTTMVVHHGDPSGLEPDLSIDLPLGSVRQDERHLRLAVSDR